METDKILIDTQPENSVMLFEEKPTGKKKFTVAPGIVDSEVITVLVTESDGKKINIKKGEVVGILSTVAVMDNLEEPASDWTAARIKEEIPLTSLTEDQRKQAWDVIERSSCCIGKDSKDVGMAAVTAHIMKLQSISDPEDSRSQ